MESFEEIVDFVSVSVYDTENDASNGGGSMTSREAIIAALKATGTTQAEGAARLGWSAQQLSGRLMRNSMRADEFLEFMDAIGIDVSFVVRESGAALKTHIAGAGRRVRAMVDKVKYDTEAASALANNFFADGKNEYTDGKAMELYVDDQGRYFFAEYTNWEGAKDRITPVSGRDAAAFINKYGTDLHRKPKDAEDEGQN